MKQNLLQIYSKSSCSSCTASVSNSSASVDLRTTEMTSFFSSILGSSSGGSYVDDDRSEKSNIKIDGYLTKQGSIVPTWKPRFFELHSSIGRGKNLLHFWENKYGMTQLHCDIHCLRNDKTDGNFTGRLIIFSWPHKARSKGILYVGLLFFSIFGGAIRGTS